MLMERLRVERGVEGRDDETKTKKKFWTTIIHVLRRLMRRECAVHNTTSWVARWIGVWGGILRAQQDFVSACLCVVFYLKYVSIMCCSSIISIWFDCLSVVRCFKTVWVSNFCCFKSNGCVLEFVFTFVLELVAIAYLCLGHRRLAWRDIGAYCVDSIPCLDDCACAVNKERKKRKNIA